MTDALRDVAAMLRGLEGAAPEVATEAAPLLEEALRESLAAGQSPDGAAWDPRKAGGRAYAHAASRVTAAASGDVLRATLTGPEVYGHLGARGAPVRRMLPDAGAEVPPSVAEAIEEAASRVLARRAR